MRVKANGTGRRTIIVNGGGIAGLTAALCLSRAGFRVDVFEKASGFETTGAGLQISPNALHVLEMLGLSRHVKNVANGPSAIRIMAAASGREIVGIPLGASAIRRYGLPYLVVHRGDLHQVLSRAAHEDPDIRLHLNARIEDIAEHAYGLTALAYSEGRMSEFHGIALIAADGVWSPLRQRLFGLAPARYQGLLAWRALITTEQLPGSRDLENSQLWLARNAHAVTYPVRGGRYLNVIVITRDRKNRSGVAPDPDWTRPATASEVNDQLSGWHDDFLSLFTYRSRWTCWPLFAMRRARTLAAGRAALAGDAAHAMLPFAAQGAAMAIEDAAVLAQHLGASGSLGDDGAGVRQALLGYQKSRRTRVARAAGLSAVNRIIYHLPQPLALARDLTMMALGGDRLLRRNDWLYNWRCDVELVGQPSRQPAVSPD
jgi:salicylate hydroxylase